MGDPLDAAAVLEAHGAGAMSLPADLRFVVRLPCGPCGGTGGREVYLKAASPGLSGYAAKYTTRPDCEHCGGEGHVESTVTLAELREVVDGWVVSPLVPAGELDEVVSSLKRSMTAAASKSEGLADPDDVGSWLRACQEAAEALRAVAELRPRPRDD